MAQIFLVYFALVAAVNLSLFTMSHEAKLKFLMSASTIMGILLVLGIGFFIGVIIIVLNYGLNFYVGGIIIGALVLFVVSSFFFLLTVCMMMSCNKAEIEQLRG